MTSFSAQIFKIGINPYVLLPEPVLRSLFKQAGKDKGAIPVRGSLNGNSFTQTLVKYSGKWRLYLNTPMRKAAGIDVGDTAKVKIEYDQVPRIVAMHPKLKQALVKNKKAKTAFGNLTPSRQKEILRYIGSLKSDESVITNIEKVIKNLLGKGRFGGRD
jgi:hypothetical protein